MNKLITYCLVAVFCLLASDIAEAKRSTKKKRRHSGPPPTHPMVLWAKTLNESQDREQRRVAAYKLAQYSGAIVNSQVVDAIVKCGEDSDVEIKVLCTKALSHAGSNASYDNIRRVLLDRYKKDESLKDTVVRAFIVRKDSSAQVHEAFFDELKKSPSLDHRLILMSYFEACGTGSNQLVDRLVEQYQKDENIRYRRAIAKVLAARAQGQDAAVGLFAGCSDSKDTPLALICLDGLKSQARKDARAWSAVEKSIQSSDSDMMMATLDVINALPETPNANITARLLEILKESDDPDILEKTALALGVCGDHSEAVVNGLLRVIDDKETDDAVRVAAVLVLGRQAAVVSDQSIELLDKCLKENNSQSLKTACQLAKNELNQRLKAKAIEKKPASPEESPAKAQAPDTNPESKTATN